MGHGRYDRADAGDEVGYRHDRPGLVDGDIGSVPAAASHHGSRIDAGGVMPRREIGRQV
jgi:hypothetical protein